MNGSTGFFAVALATNLRYLPHASCMAGHPDVGGEAPQHAEAALAVGLLFWIPRRCQHPEVARAHDVQHAVTVADGERPRGAAARVAAGDVRGERDRPDADRVAVLEPVVDARGAGSRGPRSR